MRILHVVTLASPEGSYGGPLTVARGQSAELARRGHRVHLVASRDPGGTVTGDGYDVTLGDVVLRLPVGRHSGIVAPRAVRAAARLARDADVVHVHLGRDLVTLPAALAALRYDTPLVLQTHGMVKPDRRSSAVLLDRLAVKDVLRRAGERLVLTETDAANLRDVAGAGLSTRSIPNGIEPARSRARWVHEEEQEVVFCSRLHPRKRPEEFVRLAEEMTARGYRGRFTVLGPDEGSLAEVRALRDGLAVPRLEIGGPLAPDDVLARLAQAQAFVLPSLDEPYPMAVLEAMSLGLPSVITWSTGVSELFERGRSALVTDGGATGMADALLPVLRDQQAWESLSARARGQVQETNGMRQVGDVLEDVYATVTAVREETA